MVQKREVMDEAMLSLKSVKKPGRVTIRPVFFTRRTISYFRESTKFLNESTAYSIIVFMQNQAHRICIERFRTP